jgi:hypothetical protein
MGEINSVVGVLTFKVDAMHALVNMSSHHQPRLVGADIFSAVYF